MEMNFVFGKCEFYYSIYLHPSKKCAHVQRKKNVHALCSVSKDVAKCVFRWLCVVLLAFVAWTINYLILTACSFLSTFSSIHQKTDRSL